MVHIWSEGSRDKSGAIFARTQNYRISLLIFRGRLGIMAQRVTRKEYAAVSKWL